MQFKVWPYPAKRELQQQPLRLSHAAAEHCVYAAAQRTKHTRTDGAYTTFAYDDGGQLTVAWTTNSGGVRIDAECWGYLYDAGQNLNRRTNNASGSTSTFTVDHRNQLTSGYTYDSNGNMTYKGSDQLTYDAENQLVDYTIPGSYRTAFAYDGRGRLRLRTEYYSAGGTNWTFGSQITYLYDGMRVLQQRNGTTPMVAYTRGHDLAGIRRCRGRSARASLQTPLRHLGNAFGVAANAPAFDAAIQAAHGRPAAYNTAHPAGGCRAQRAAGRREKPGRAERALPLPV